MDRALELLLEVEHYWRKNDIYSTETRRQMTDKIDELEMVIKEHGTAPTHAYYWAYEDTRLLIDACVLSDPMIEQYKEIMREAKKHASRAEINAFLTSLRTAIAAPETRPEPKIQKNTPQKKGRCTKKLNYSTLREQALKKLRTEPDLNELKTPELSRYFKRLIHQEQFRRLSHEEQTEQKEYIQDVLTEQEQKDQNISYQISILLLAACAPRQWKEFEDECRRIAEELKKTTNYDQTKIIRCFGPEMAILKIIRKEQLPQELIKVVDQLLPANF